MNKMDMSMATRLSFLLPLIVFFTVACKELPGKLNVPPVKPADTQVDNAAHLSPSGISTGETPLSTPQMSVAAVTSEINASPEMNSTSENAPGGANKLFVTKKSIMFKRPRYNSMRLSKLAPGDAVAIMPDSYATMEWVHVTDGQNDGYIESKLLCQQLLCIDKRRCGLWNDSLYAEEIRAPLIQLRITNLFPNEISQLKIKGFFYYNGEKIGEDEIFVAMDYLGIRPMAAGGTITSPLRAMYDMGPDMELTPENPVEVELFYALDNYNYVPYGKFYIDHTVY